MGRRAQLAPAAPSKFDDAKIRELEDASIDGSAKPQKSAATNRRGTASTPHTRKDGVQTRTMSVAMPTELHKRLKVRSVEDDVTMSALVALAVEQLLDR